MGVPCRRGRLPGGLGVVAQVPGLPCGKARVDVRSHLGGGCPVPRLERLGCEPEAPGKLGDDPGRGLAAPDFEQRDVDGLLEMIGHR